MKLTTKSEYTILALLYLARHEDEVVKIKHICEDCHISKKYLESLFLKLRQHKLIITKLGPNGGYQLAKPANKIFLAEIIRIMDGALAPTLAASYYFHEQTPISKEKKVLTVMKDIRDYVSNKLEKTSLAELI